MELPIVDNNNNKSSSCESSSFFRDDGDEKVEEAMDLLEECWFFDNMLNITSSRPSTRMIMPRCHSDPYPSSTTGLTINPDFLVKVPQKTGELKKMIQRAPSMPPLRDHREEGGGGDDKEGTSSTRKGNHHHHHRSDSSNSRRKSKKLLRTPSLPPSIGREEKFQESDHHRNGGRSLKQTPSTPNHVDILPPRQTFKSCSIPRCRGGRNKNRNVTMRRSLSDLEHEEVQGFRDLGFSFEKEALSPNLRSIIPGLQDKEREETEEDKALRKPYLSEAWLVKNCVPLPPIIPNWAPRESASASASASDMKKQIKFWARAVASNVHQEC